MKRFGLVLAAAFIPFLVIGYLFGNVVIRGKHSTESQDIIVQAATSAQENYLYIQTVKDSNQPVRLVNIWALFFIQNEHPAATFMQIYPSKNPIRDALLTSEFVFGSEISTNGSFYTLLSDYYGIKWDGIVILDQAGFDHLAELLNGTNREIVENDDINKLLESLCVSLLSKEPTLINLEPFFQMSGVTTSITSQNVNKLTAWLKNGDSFSNCEIQHP